MIIAFLLFEILKESIFSVLNIMMGVHFSLVCYIWVLNSLLLAEGNQFQTMSLFFYEESSGTLFIEIVSSITDRWNSMCNKTKQNKKTPKEQAQS